ncbi:unnamed protein product, partial [Prorocentrum cordatum]
MSRYRCGVLHVLTFVATLMPTFLEVEVNMQNLMHVPEAVYLKVPIMLIGCLLIPVKVPEPTVVDTTVVLAPTIIWKIFAEVKELTVAEVLEPTFVEKTFVLVPTVVETIFVETTVLEMLVPTVVEKIFVAVLELAVVDATSVLVPTVVETTFVKMTVVEVRVPTFVETTLVLVPTAVETFLVETTVMVALVPTLVETTVVETNFVELTYVVPTFVASNVVESTLVKTIFAKTSFVQMTFVVMALVEAAFAVTAAVAATVMETTFVLVPTVVEMVMPAVLETIFVEKMFLFRSLSILIVGLATSCVIRFVAVALLPPGVGRGPLAPVVRLSPAGAFGVAAEVGTALQRYGVHLVLCRMPGVSMAGSFGAHFFEEPAATFLGLTTLARHAVALKFHVWSVVWSVIFGGRVKPRGHARGAFACHSAVAHRAGLADRVATKEPVDWDVGAKVILTTSELGQSDEVLTVRSVSQDGFALEVDEPLQYEHIGEWYFHE